MTTEGMTVLASLFSSVKSKSKTEHTPTSEQENPEGTSPRFLSSSHQHHFLISDEQLRKKDTQEMRLPSNQLNVASLKI